MEGMPLSFACSESVTGEAVSGTVTLNGEPLEEGQILFTPLQAGQAANAEIKAGRYEIPENRGPSPGKYRVEIRAYEDTGQTERDEVTGSAEPILKPIVPPRDNRDSELEAEVVEGGENTFDFELQSG